MLPWRNLKRNQAAGRTGARGHRLAVTRASQPGNHAVVISIVLPTLALTGSTGDGERPGRRISASRKHHRCNRSVLGQAHHPTRRGSAMVVVSTTDRQLLGRPARDLHPPAAWNADAKDWERSTTPSPRRFPACASAAPGKAVGRVARSPGPYRWPPVPEASKAAGHCAGAARAAKTTGRPAASGCRAPRPRRRRIRTGGDHPIWDAARSRSTPLLPAADDSPHNERHAIVSPGNSP